MSITVTQAAQEKIASLCSESNMIGVRAFVYGGGCSGMNHSLTFVDEVEARDTKISDNFYIDPVAMQFMVGATVDYENTDSRQSFVFSDVFKEQGGSGGCQGCGMSY